MESSHIVSCGKAVWKLDIRWNIDIRYFIRYKVPQTYRSLALKEFLWSRELLNEEQLQTGYNLFDIWSSTGHVNWGDKVVQRLAKKLPMQKLYIYMHTVWPSTLKQACMFQYCIKCANISTVAIFQWYCLRDFQWQ